MLYRAGPSQNRRIFLENRNSRAANLQGCFRQDELGLARATPTSRRPLRSRPPYLGQARFLQGSGKEGLKTATLEKKEAVATCFLDASARFDAVRTVDDWLAKRREPGSA